jgi:hypothetical protein
MVVLFLEDAEITWLENRVKGFSWFNWIRDLLFGLTRPLTTRFPTIFNTPAATAVYLLSSEG